MTRRTVPICLGCNDHPARRLASLPGQYGCVRVFCSLKCAAKSAVEPVLCGAMKWCTTHQEWEDNDGQKHCGEADLASSRS